MGLSLPLADANVPSTAERNPMSVPDALPVRHEPPHQPQVLCRVHEAQSECRAHGSDGEGDGPPAAAHADSERRIAVPRPDSGCEFVVRDLRFNRHFGDAIEPQFKSSRSRQGVPMHVRNAIEHDWSTRR